VAKKGYDIARWGGVASAVLQDIKVYGLTDIHAFVDFPLVTS
jgi:hypothetical protein